MFNPPWSESIYKIALHFKLGPITVAVKFILGFYLIER